LEGFCDRRILPDDLHAHPDGSVGVAANESQVCFAHQTLEKGKQKLNINYQFSLLKLNMRVEKKTLIITLFCQICESKRISFFTCKAGSSLFCLLLNPSLLRFFPNCWRVATPKSAAKTAIRFSKFSSSSSSSSSEPSISEINQK
jgi:hypothetical protein